MITIASKYEGFFRCGIHHSTTPNSYPDGYFTAYQLAVLEAEPALIVLREPDAPQATTPAQTDSDAADDGAQAQTDSAAPAEAEPTARPKKRGKA